MASATIHISQDGTWAGTGKLVRHPDGTVSIEDCWAILGPRGLNHESGEQQDAAERVYAAIEAAIARGEDSVALEGSVYTWEIEQPPAIEVLGLGAEDWDSDEYADSCETEEERRRRESRRRWERYGTVRVRVGDVVYDVGCAIGVPPELRATAEAAGGDTTRPAYLAAWYVTWSDWACAPASAGRDGVPSELADDVLRAISDSVARLWREYQQERENAEAGA
uniref:DUF4376 domain-containing protein n=1 Tax=Thermocrispum agreste TaxID=37925 RepID=A0A2W4ISJ8_9PSEU|nr:MAG: hypothetical protein DIU77_20210 [Thermocrispum agreste]